MSIPRDFVTIGPNCCTCAHHDGEEERCGLTGETRFENDTCCESYEQARGLEYVISERQLAEVIVNGVEPILRANVDQMGKYLLQMGQLLGTLQKRMDEMEARQKQVTICHADTKKLQARIRARADAFCGKYGLEDAESVRQARAAIRKELLRTFQVKDLHDLPATLLPAAEKQIDGWTSIRFAMDRRKGVRA